MTYKFTKDYATRYYLTVEADSLEEAVNKAAEEYRWEEEEPCYVQHQVYVAETPEQMDEGDCQEVPEEELPDVRW